MYSVYIMRVRVRRIIVITITRARILKAFSLLFSIGPKKSFNSDGWMVQIQREPKANNCVQCLIIDYRSSAGVLLVDVLKQGRTGAINSSA